MKKSLYKPRKLTYKEHQKIDKFLRYWNSNGKEVFDLLRQSYGDYEEPVERMSKAINLMSALHQFCENRSYRDKPSEIEYGSEEWSQWNTLYFDIGLWTTIGWRK